MGFIGYRRDHGNNAEETIRIYLECQDEASGKVSCGFVVDIAFPAGVAACLLRGVGTVLALKKFYKLVFSLEERAREHGNDWRAVMESPERVLEHLRYTRNARDFTGKAAPVLSQTTAEFDPECARIGEGT